MVSFSSYSNSIPYDYCGQGLPQRHRCFFSRFLSFLVTVLCSKVALLTTILALGVVLPINLTAQCFSSENGFKSSCLDPTNAKTAYTNYMRTTLANIPPSVSRIPAINQTIPVLFKPFVTYEWGGPSSNRLYGIVLCAWIIYFYACTLLQNEWKEVLALRRVYYLENDLWARRKRELETTIYASSDEEEEEDDDDDYDGRCDIDNNLKDRDKNEGMAARDIRKSSRISKLDQLKQRRAKRRLAWIKKMEKRHNLRKRNPWIPPPGKNFISLNVRFTAPVDRVRHGNLMTEFAEYSALSYKLLLDIVRLNILLRATRDCSQY